MYSCPGCGSQMTFDIAGQQLKCGRCDRTMSIAEADAKEARQAGSSFAVDLFSCPTCGAEIKAMNTAAASFCSYCGSSVMLNRREALLDPPETIAPFRVTREQCFEKYQQTLKKSLCADHRLKKDITPDSFRGIYVPFHTYKAMVNGEAVLKGTETKGDTTYYYDTKVYLNHQYEGILHDGSREMPDTLSERISRTDRKYFVPFSPAYLSGFYSDEADTNQDAYIPYAKTEAIRNGLQDTLEDLKDGLSYSVNPSRKELMKLAEAEYTGDTLVPVWFMSMKSGKRVLYAVQNGVTGEMYADRPLDIPRFAILTGILALVLFAVFSLFLTLRPEMAMLVAMLLAVGAQVAVNGRRKAAFEREHSEDVPDPDAYDMNGQMKKMDKLASRAKNKNGSAILSYGGILIAVVAIAIGLFVLSEMGDIRIYKLAAAGLAVIMGILVFAKGKRSGKILPGSIAALLAMAAGAVIMIADPFHSDDFAVYAVTAGVTAGVIWELLDLLKVFNRSCSNPLPQFESHQGGEDLA